MSGHATFLRRKPLPEARELLLRGIGPVDAEEVDAEQACGRVAAETVVAVHPSPHYRASAMDGVAVRAADTFSASAGSPVRLRVRGPQQPEGSASREPDGTAVCRPVDTGSPLPDWADAVLRIEDVTVSGDTCIVKTPTAPGRDIRRAGEDVEDGAVVVPAGARLTPYDVGVALATGTSRIRVRRRPTVAIIATGNEVIEPGVRAEPGQVIEYNSRVLAGLIAGWGGQARRAGIVADEEEALASTIAEACRTSDAVCVIAGSSAGRRDLTVPVLERLGELLVHGIDIAPGRPVGLARVGATPVVAVPGYPVSAVVASEQLLRPLLAALLGTAERTPDTVEAIVRRKIPSRLGVEEFRRVCLAAGEDGYVAAPLPSNAGSISTVAGAHGWLRIPSDSEGVDAGARVTIELMATRAQIDAALVVAGRYSPAAAHLERRLREVLPQARVHYLRLAGFDAIGGVARGEAHLALGGDLAGEASGCETPLLALRVSAEGKVEETAWATESGCHAGAALRALLAASILLPA